MRAGSKQRKKETLVPIVAGMSTLCRDESGQTLVFAALCMVVLIGFLGIAIDVGHLRYAKSQLQLAADAAALAAGLELRVCGNVRCSGMIAAGQSALSENGLPTSTIVYDCATMPSGTLGMSLNLPPCALGTTDPNTGKTGFLEVQLQQPVSTFFAGLFGWKTVNMTARAEVWHGGAPCIYALDTQSAGAISVTAGLTTNCSIVNESTSASAFTCTAGTISAPQITIAGGSSGLLCTVSPKARTGAPVPTPADPLKYLPVPTVPACGTSLASPYYGSSVPLTLAAGTYKLFPDKAYCGGITIQAGANVTFAPGTYVLTGPAVTSVGLNISPLATITGTGVTFYNAGPKGAFSMTGTGSGSIALSAPTSGTYSGILYFQATANTNAATISASSSNALLQGGFYMPAAQLSYFAAKPGAYTVMVAKDISFTASSLTLLSDFSSLASGSPINADNVRLIQ